MSPIAIVRFVICICFVECFSMEPATPAAHIPVCAPRPSSDSCRFGLCQTEVCHHQITDLELLDFPSNGLWKGLDEANISRNLEMSEVTAAEDSDLVLG